MNNCIIKKFLSGAMALIASLNIIGCSDKLTDEEIGKAMETVLTQLFTAVQNNDKEGFKSFFADHVMELTDFDQGCDYVFEKYNGNLTNVKFRSGGHTGRDFVPGETIDYAYMTFFVNTNEKEYMACVEFYTKYESKYPVNSYKIRKFSLIEKQNNGDFEDFDGFNLRYGIYYPGWTDGIEY